MKCFKSARRDNLLILRKIDGIDLGRLPQAHLAEEAMRSTPYPNVSKSLKVKFEMKCF